MGIDILQQFNMGGGGVGQPIKQHIINGIKNKLVSTMGTDIEIFDTEIPDNFGPEIDLPFIVFKLGNLAIRNFMGNVNTDFITTLNVDLVTDADAGPAETRTYEEILYRGLHKVFLTCEGYVSVKIRCINRGDCKSLPDRLLITSDTFEIYGSENI